MERKVEVGDWVCFQQLGSPSYALVLYVLDAPAAGVLGKKIVTTAGEYRESDTLEIRSHHEHS